MLTLPKLVTYEAKPYIATRKSVSIPFGDDIDPAMGAAQAYIEAQGVKDFGPAIFKYNRVQMPGLEIDFGFLTPTRLPGIDGLVSGELPAGTYATTTYTGHYDNLMEVNAVLIGWARHKGIEWDATETPDGDLFVSRVEFYLDGPEGDPNTWRTEVAIKVRDGAGHV